MSPTATLRCLGTAFVSGTAVFLHEILSTRLCDLPGYSFRLGWRTFKTIALEPWFPGCGYYQWAVSESYYGKARWFWRKPKGPRWYFADDYTLGWSVARN